MFEHFASQISIIRSSNIHCLFTSLFECIRQIRKLVEINDHFVVCVGLIH